eukprot:jgi/Tetstr1/461524/TSEL_006630.t1
MSAAGEATGRLPSMKFRRFSVAEHLATVFPPDPASESWKGPILHQFQESHATPNRPAAIAFGNHAAALLSMKGMADEALDSA